INDISVQRIQMYKILVVEDNADNLAVLEAFLEDDYTLVNAEDGKVGLEMAILERPDLILMDISLPEMDGTEVLAEIRRIEGIKNTPTIALTAHAMVGDKEKYLALGFEAYVSKPILDDEELIELIESLIKGA
ncbi:MAG: response regulator, partial [Campylobacterota bacterium]|nr:response regulator [Campylobacterota bacterium]